jgi:MFS family permease
MEMQRLMNRTKKKASPSRRHLIAATVEGFPAITTLTLLGAPFLTGYLLLLGASSFQIGLILAIPFITNVIQIPVAYFMQRFTNRKWGLVLFAAIHRICWTLTGAVPFLVSENHYFELYLLFYLVAFIGNAVGGVIWTSLIADMVPAKVRGRYFGIRNTILWGLASFTLFIGGYILDQFPGIEGYHILFAICAVGSILNILTLALYPNLPFERSAAPNLNLMLKIPFEDKDFLRSMVFITIWLFLQNLVVPLYSLIMLSVMGLTEFVVSVLTIVMTISMMVSYYFWGNLNARIPTRKLLLWTFPIIAVSCLLWGAILVIPAMAVLVLIHIFLGIGTGGYNLLVFNFTIGDTPKGDRPMYLAVFAAITGIAAFLGPTVGGFIFGLIEDMPQWFQISGVTTGIGIVLTLLVVFYAPYVFTNRVRR